MSTDICVCSGAAEADCSIRRLVSMQTQPARSAPSEFRGRRWTIIAAVGILVISLVGLAWHLLHRPAGASAERQSPAVTTYEMSPTFSPDGTQVAYAWDGGQPGKFDIYVRPATGGA